MSVIQRLFGPPTIYDLKAKRDIPGLVRALKYRKDSLVRKDAADALGEIGDRRGVGALIEALRDEELYVACAAARALGKTGDPSAVDALLAIALSIHGLKGSQGELAIACTEALGNIGDPRAVEPLITALPTSTGWAISKALGRIGDHRAVEPLIAELKSGDAYRIVSAVEALVRMGDPRSIEPLTQSLWDSGGLILERWEKGPLDVAPRMYQLQVQDLIAAELQKIRDPRVKKALKSYREEATGRAKAIRQEQLEQKAREEQIADIVSPLTDALVGIAMREGFLGEAGGLYDEDGRHSRAREVGAQLDQLGGIELMRQVRMKVQAITGRGRELDFAWSSIGEWIS